MTPIKRPLAAASASVLLALALTACGGGSAPSDASEKEFCDAQRSSAGTDLLDAFGAEDWDKAADLIKEQAEKAEEIGTPKGIPDDAREGFEIQLDASKSIDGDDLKKASESKDGEDPFAGDFSDDDMKKAEAFGAYVADTCSDTGSDSPAPSSDSDEDSSDPGVGEGDETEVPDLSDLPSNFPTELPEGFPTDPADIPTDPEELQKLMEELAKQ